MNWIDIGTLDDIPRRGARCVETLEGRIGVFRTHDDEVFAIKNTCPHRGGPLSEGIVHGHAVTCPLHNMVLSLKTGEAMGADEGRVKTYAVRMENGRIFIALDDILAAAE
jgi:nitrite reductase (NADH) small subunit